LGLLKGWHEAGMDGVADVCGNLFPMGSQPVDENQPFAIFPALGFAKTKFWAL
jgi:hypothetical protein